jgi:hypothetical protein
MERDRITQEGWERALSEVRSELDRRVAEKGDGAFASLHEAWGVIDEEIREFKDGVQAKDRLNAHAELLDIAVAAIVGIASMEAEAQRPCRDCGKVGHSAEDHGRDE